MSEADKVTAAVAEQIAADTKAAQDNMTAIYEAAVQQVVEAQVQKQAAIMAEPAVDTPVAPAVQPTTVIEKNKSITLGGVWKASKRPLFYAGCFSAGYALGYAVMRKLI